MVVSKADSRSGTIDIRNPRPLSEIDIESLVDV